MDFNRLTTRAQEALGATQSIARERGNPEIYPAHLLLTLLEQELPQTLVERAGSSADALRQKAEADVAHAPSVQGATNLQPRISAPLERVLDRASDEARSMDDDFVAVEHMLLALDVIDRSR